VGLTSSVLFVLDAVGVDAVGVDAVGVGTVLVLSPQPAALKRSVAVSNTVNNDRSEKQWVVERNFFIIILRAKIFSRKA
jgi:hypothetical protein